MVDALFAVADVHLYTIFIINIFCQVLGAIYRPVLAAGASEREHERRESALNVASHVGVGQPIDAVEEGEYFAVVLQEADDGLVESREFLVGFISSGVVG